MDEECGTLRVPFFSFANSPDRNMRGSCAKGDGKDQPVALERRVETTVI